MRILSFFLEVILISRFTQPVSAGIQVANGPNCEFLTMPRQIPCLRAYTRANRKCKSCKMANGRRRKLCMTEYKRKYMKNVDSCTIKSLNDLRYNNRFNGESELSIRSVRFSHHGIDGKFIRDDVGLRILGGRNAKPKQIPWQVQIVNHHGDPICSGTLVTSNKIVSAAHCYHKKKWQKILKPENLYARAGRIKRKGRGGNLQQTNCTYIIFHP